GYPESLLDAYLRTPRTARDSATAPLPSDDVLDAIGALGMGDSTDTSALRETMRARRLRDTTRVDRRALDDSIDTDSLGDIDSLPRRPRPRAVRADSGMA